MKPRYQGLWWINKQLNAPVYSAIHLLSKEMLNRYILDLSLKFNDLRLYSCISQVSRPPMVELMQDNTYQPLGLNSYGLLGDCLYLFDAYLYQCRFSCIQHGKLFLRESMCIMYYCDVIMGAMASQITSLTIVYSTVHSDANQRKHQSSASLAFVRGIHRWPVNSPHKWPVTRKMFTFDDVIMYMNLSQQAFCALTDTTFTDQIPFALQWRHNGRDSVSNHQPNECLLNRLFIWVQINENIKAPRHWPLCGEFTGDRWIPRTNGQ